MERKIGEIFEFGGEWYQCVGGTCRNCSFYYDTACKNITTIGSTNFGNCHCSLRTDHKSVIFKKLEKVGEPFISVGKLYQHYKVFEIDNVCGDVFWCVHNYKAKTLTIELKQNKEDMEEKKLNLKPLDIQKAREGYPVCTRDGRKARIICFDAKGNKPLIILSEIDGKEVILRYTEKGQSDNFHSPTPREDDLMMCPVKRTGYINIYDNNRVCKQIFETEDEAKIAANIIPAEYLKTIKIEWEE